MTMNAGIHQLNVATLLKLQDQIATLATTVSEILSLNEHVATKSILSDEAMIQPFSSGLKQIPVAREVRRLLQLAGEDGTTVEEIIHILSKKRPIVPQTVRCALRRCRDEGRAKSLGRRWYAVH